MIKTFIILNSIFMGFGRLKSEENFGKEPSRKTGNQNNENDTSISSLEEGSMMDSNSCIEDEICHAIQSAKNYVPI